MNAKKIMGAVLVALLAAALFVGAGAAATAAADGTTVFVNEKINKTNYTGNWVGPNGVYTPAVDAGDAESVYFKEAGVYKYTNQTDDAVYTITVVEPSLTITGIANKGKDYAYTFIPGTLYEGATDVVVNVTNVSSANIPYTLWLTLPDGTETPVTVTNNGLDHTFDTSKFGKYSLRAEFALDNFTIGTAPADRQTEPVTFTIAKKGGDVTISAAANTVLKSEAIKLTITGQPGVTYNVTYDDYAFKVAEKQFGFTFMNLSDDLTQKTGINFTMPTGGKVEFAVKANASAVGDSEKITVKAVDVNGAKQASVLINFAKGTISAKTEKASYFVGDDVKVIGTTTAGQLSHFIIEGNNFYNATTFTVDEDGDNFEFVINTGALLDIDSPKKMDVGTYTLTIGNADANATVAITLKQPFINIVSAPEVITQGEEDVEIIINAEAATHIGYYIFGNNFYYFDKEFDQVMDEDGEPIKNQFLIELDDVIKTMDAGQYFIVFQHPMNNETLDVYGAKGSWVITVPTGQNIKVEERQTANAAQALCDALESQGIDDMYVKATFFVSDKDNSFSMSEIPATVAQGETITISGVDTVNKGKPVVVEMLSAAFTAIPKEDENAAAFIVVTTTVADDGTWEVTLDTSALNVDEYNVAVKIAGEIKKTAKVNVVEAGDEPVDPEQPGDEPEQPGDEPVAPETPGFGALAALAGLGAVAVLLLRRE